jgi:hypothetical protein
VVHEGFLAFSCLDSVKGYFHVGNGLSSCVVFGGFVQLLREKEVLEAVGGKLLFDLSGVVVYFFVSLLGLGLCGIH